MNAEEAPSDDERTPAKQYVHERSRSLKGGLDPSEMGQRSGAARRARRAAREQHADEARLTLRQRLGIVLSELTLDELRDVRNALLAEAKRGDEKAVHALARLFDQSFGRSEPQADEKEADGPEIWESMPPAKRAALRAQLLREAEEEERRATGDPSDPRATESL
jgi:hypothetical protein